MEIRHQVTFILCCRSAVLSKSLIWKIIVKSNLKDLSMKMDGGRGKVKSFGVMTPLQRWNKVLYSVVS